MPNDILVPRPIVEKLAYASPQEYLRVERSEINDRVCRLAMSGEFNEKFVSGQKLYQDYKKSLTGKPSEAKNRIKTSVEKHQFSLHDKIPRPDPVDIEYSPLHEQTLLEQREAEAAKTVAVQLGFLYQSLAENDIGSAIVCLKNQQEILDSPPIASTVSTKMVEILRTDLSSLPDKKELLQTIASWTLNHPVAPELLDLVDIENGISLSRASLDRTKNSSYQLAHQISHGLIGGAKNVGYAGEGEVSQHLARTLVTLRENIIGKQLSADDPLAGDQHLAGKLLDSLISDASIFDRLHPDVQNELTNMMEGYLIDSQVDRSVLIILPIASPQTIPSEIPIIVPETTIAKGSNQSSLKENDLDEKTLLMVSALDNLENITELHQVVSGQHNLIKGELAQKIAKLAEIEFSRFWNDIKKGKRGGINLIFTKIFQQDHIAISESDRIDDTRREIENSQPYIDKDPEAIAKVVAINLVKSHIRIFNGERKTS